VVSSCVKNDQGGHGQEGPSHFELRSAVRRGGVGGCVELGIRVTIAAIVSEGSNQFLETRPGESGQDIDSNLIGASF
jgi:hypothetical protein